MKVEIVTKSELETMTLGEQIAERLEQGDVITLEGELGTGKTTFVKGIAKGLSIERTVTSPTFTIIKEYEGRLPLYHMDAYRLEDAGEDIGFDEYIYGSGVTIIEWAQFIDEFIPKERLTIELQYIDEQSRKVIISSTSLRYKKILNKLNYFEG